MSESKTEIHKTTFLGSKLVANAEPLNEFERKFSQFQDFLAPYLQHQPGHGSDTKLVHWVLFNGVQGPYSLLDTSSAMRDFISKALDGSDESVSFSKDDQNLVVHFYQHLHFVTNLGLSLKIPSNSEAKEPRPRLSKKNYNTLYQTALAVLPLYQLALQFNKLLAEKSENLTLSTADFAQLVSEALNHPLPADDEFSRILSALERVNFSIAKLCDTALDNFLKVLQHSSGQSKRRDGQPVRPVADIQALAHIVRVTGTNAKALELVNACVKIFGQQHEISLEAKRLLECYESPATCYLKHSIDLEKEVNSPLRHYRSLQPLIFDQLADQRSESPSRSHLLALELSRNPSPERATFLLQFAFWDNFASEALIRTFLAYGADINNIKIFTTHHQTPLEWACKNNPDLVPLFLEAGAQFDDALLFQARDLTTLKRLHEAGARLDMQDDFGNSLLHYACKQRSASMMEYLLKQGCNPNIKNQNGQTAAHLAYTTMIPAFPFAKLGDFSKAKNPIEYLQENMMACWQCPINLDILRLLEEYKADLSAKDNLGLTPLDHSQVSGCYQEIDKFRKGITYYPEEVFELVVQGKPDKVAIVKQYLIEGGDANLMVGGISLISQSALCGYDELIKLLLDSGARPDDQVFDSKFKSWWSYQTTPLFLACIKGKKGSIKLLLEHGADLNRFCSPDLTPFFAACERGDAEAVWLMVDLAYEQLLKVSLKPRSNYNTPLFNQPKTKTADELGNQALKLLLNMLQGEKAQGADNVRIRKLEALTEHLVRQINCIEETVANLWNEAAATMEI